MTPQELLEDLDPPALTADGFEDALIGYVERFGMSAVALYDRDKCIQVLVDRDGMTEEEAEEFFSFNTIGAWVGDATPCFATLGSKK